MGFIGSNIPGSVILKCVQEMCNLSCLGGFRRLLRGLHKRFATVLSYLQGLVRFSYAVYGASSLQGIV